MTSTQFQGEFAVWSFTIGHGRLLLRRTKSDAHPTRIDILLTDVGWMCLPMSFTNIQLREVALEDIRDMLGGAGALREKGRKAFVLSGAGATGYVLAGAFAVHEDDGEYNDPSALLD